MKNTKIRLLASVLIVAMLLSLCAGCSQSQEAQNDAFSDTDAVSDADVQEEVLLEPDQFVHAEGLGLVDENGSPYLMRGVNFANNALCNPQQMFFDPYESYYAELHSMGVNSIRFSLNYGLFENDDEPYVYKESGFEWVDKNLELAKKYDIKIMLSFVPQGCWKMLGWSQDIWKDEECQKRFVALSTEIARRYANEPNILGYGLIGEPVIPIETTVEDALSLWQDLAQRTVDSIRTVDKNHIIFVERAIGCSYDSWEENGWDWSGTYPNDDFVKVDDDNIVYEFHNYDPESFTSQAYEDYVTYPMPKYGYKELKKALSKTAELQEYLEAPVLCGEFGCASKCYEEEYNGQQWFDDFTNICEELGINFTLYAYKDWWYDEELLYTTYWNENIVEFFKDKYGDLAGEIDESVVIENSSALTLPEKKYTFGSYMMASGVNCVLMPCYLSGSFDYHYPNEPLLAWIGDQTWQILFDLNDIGEVAETDKLGDLILEVISYGEGAENQSVKFVIESVEMKSPDGSYFLEGYPQEHSMWLAPDEFDQNSNMVIISDFGEDIQSYDDLRQYRMVIKVRMEEYGSYYDLP